jgi:hypothetical protein
MGENPKWELLKLPCLSRKRDITDRSASGWLPNYQMNDTDLFIRLGEYGTRSLQIHGRKTSSPP